MSDNAQWLHSWYKVLVNNEGVVFGIAPKEKRSKFFCTNCRIWGHNIDRCFKVRINNREQKSTQCVPTSEAIAPPVGTTTVPSAAPVFTQEQMRQLTAML